MIGKAGLAAVVLISLVAAGRGVDLRQLYDEMYPVNTLKRDAFNLCQQSDPTFIRALEDDRENCYDRMPHSIALAIGRIRPGNPLGGLFAVNGGFPGETFQPAAGLYSSTVQPRSGALSRGYSGGIGAMPCADRPGPAAADRLRTAQALEVLAGRPAAKTPEAALAEMGLLPKQRGATPPHAARGGAPLPAEAAGLTAERPETITPLDTVSGDVGEDSEADASACREHI